MSSAPVDRSAQVPRVTLNDGVTMPWLGFGTSAITPDEVKHWLSTKSKAHEFAGEPAYESIKHAVRCGYRFIDTAALYLNEEIVGQALNDAIKEGLVTREELFVCTKVWCTAHKRKSVMLAAKESLEKLQMDYVDLYLIHWPVAYLDRFEPGEPVPVAASGQKPVDRLINPRDPKTGKLLYSDTDYKETWLGMQDVKDAGLARSIGVSNFNHKMIDDILSMPGFKYAPTVNQMEIHPYLSQAKLADYSRKHNIVLNAYCPLGSPGASWLPPNVPDVIKDPLIGELAQKYGKSPAQIILRYHLDRGISPIPKSVTPKRIEENLDVFDFKLSETDLGKMMALDKNIRYCLNTAGEIVDDHPLYPFHEEY